MAEAYPLSSEDIASLLKDDEHLKGDVDLKNVKRIDGNNFSRTDENNEKGGSSGLPAPPEAGQPDRKEEQGTAAEDDDLQVNEVVAAIPQRAHESCCNVSEEAEREYKALQQKYELEKQCRGEAEQFPTEIQNKALKKQNNVLLAEAASDPKLMLALHKVEQLTQELETQKQKYEQEIKELKKAAKSEDKMFEELDNSADLDKLKHWEAKVKQFEDQYNQLKERYFALEARFEEATRPPPPPPPPPPPSLTTKEFFSKVRSEKKKPAGAQNVPQMDTFSKALSEIMERINSGKLLTPHAKAPLQRWQKMKRTHSEADKTSLAGGEAREESSADTPSEPAFAFTLKKRSASVDTSVPEKKEEQPEFLTADFKLKGGRLKQLLNPMDEENN